MTNEKSYNLDKFCRCCQIVGYDIKVCRKYAKEQQQWKRGKSHKNKCNDNDNSAGFKSRTKTDY